MFLAWLRCLFFLKYKAGAIVQPGLKTCYGFFCWLLSPGLWRVSSLTIDPHQTSLIVASDQPFFTILHHHIDHHQPSNIVCHHSSPTIFHQPSFTTNCNFSPSTMTCPHLGRPKQLRSRTHSTLSLLLATYGGESGAVGGHGWSSVLGVPAVKTSMIKLGTSIGSSRYLSGNVQLFIGWLDWL